MTDDVQLYHKPPDLSFEQALWSQGLLWVAGFDEAGRGALAGPVCSAVVILPANPQIGGQLHGVRDSKKMTPTQREHWAEIIKELAVAWGIGFASAAEIDQIRIVQATRLAACRAIDQLPVVPDHLILDYLFLPDMDLPQTALIKGDARCLSVACASVLAKTARDAWMERVDDQYPEYGFAVHKGYGTASHRSMIRQVGPCGIHRLSFRLFNDIQDSEKEESLYDTKR